MHVRFLAPLQLDRLGNLPEHDPDNGHRLAGNEVLVVQWRTLSMPLRLELVLARLRPQKLAETHLRRSRSRSFNRSSTARKCG